MLWTQATARAIATGCLLSVLLLATSAGAASVTVYADGSADFGFDPNDVAAAISMGAAPPIEVGGLIGGEGFFSITTPDGIPGTLGKSKAKPARGTSTWTLQVDEDLPEPMLSLLDNLTLVILGHDPNDPLRYKTEDVGLQIDTELPWLFVNPAGTSQTYVAFRTDLICPDLAPGSTCPIPIRYRVGQMLKEVNDEFVFPRYSVAYVSLPVPEPSVLTLLLGAAAVGFAVRRAR